MIHSMTDNEIGKEEFELMVDQDHFEKVWDKIVSGTPDYFVSYLEAISQSNPSMKPAANISFRYKQIIADHDKSSKKYIELFDPDLMEEYEEDVDGFKGTILRHQCPVIQKTLSSKAEALKDWKIQFRLAKPQELFDTFYNMISFAEEYDDNISEEELEDINTIEDIGFAQMVEDACYFTGVVGPGILSTVLNSIYPRIFPGKFKIGMFALFLLSGIKPIDMRSDSSEFLMVKDDIHSKTGIYETEHNYFYPYETFGLYASRIYRVLDELIFKQYEVKFPDEYRYVLTNDFYEYVFDVNKDAIITGSVNSFVLCS